MLDAKESPEATQDLLNEASVMAQVAGHRNLVSIIDVITRGDPLVLVLQYCEHGSVLDVLKAQAAEGTPITFANKMHMALDVAFGMEYLSSLRFIHGDLASRNVLVADGKHGGGLDSVRKAASLVCKVADFGLSRGGGNIDGGDGEGSSESYYKSSNGVFPVRWTAPEAMETLRFTQASDVWSFAVVVVELLQNGTSPYHGQSNPDVMKLVLSGGRHSKPSDDCTDELFKCMLLCWHQDVAKRPTFARVVEHFKPLAEPAGKPEVEPRKDSNKKLNGADNEYTGFGFGDEVDEDAANGADGNVAVGVTGNGTNAGGQYIKVGDGTGVAGDEVDEDAANGADGNVAVGVMGNGTNAGGQYIKVGDGTEVAGEDYEYSKNTEQAPPAKEKKKKKKKKKAEKAEKGTTETTVMNAAFDNDAAATGL